MKKLLYILFFIILNSPLLAQEVDSVYMEWDSTAVDTMYYDEENVIVYKASPDTSIITKRSFNEEKIKELKADPDLNFKEAPTVAESLWDRFWHWIGRLIESFFDTAVNTSWGQVLVYLITLALLVALIMMVLKVNAFRVLYSGDGANVKYNVIDENIHEMNFDLLIEEALGQNDFRRAIRLMFLHSLKLLSDKQFIHWQSGKTNHDYVAELKQSELRNGFNELSYYFDYAWYGNFSISPETISRIQTIFNDFKDKLR